MSWMLIALQHAIKIYKDKAQTFALWSCELGFFYAAERWSVWAVIKAVRDDRHQNTLKQSLYFPKTTVGLPLKSCPCCMLRCVCIFRIKNNKPWQKRANKKVQAVTHQTSWSVRSCVRVAVPSNEDAQQINVVSPCQQHSHTKSQFEHK